jgi:hypothetical protein
VARCTLTFVLVDNDRDSDSEADDDDRDRTRPVKSEANDEGSCLLGGTGVSGSGSQADSIVL